MIHPQSDKQLYPKIYQSDWHFLSTDSMSAWNYCPYKYIPSRPTSIFPCSMFCFFSDRNYIICYFYYFSFVLHYFWDLQIEKQSNMRRTSEKQCLGNVSVFFCILSFAIFCSVQLPKLFPPRILTKQLAVCIRKFSQKLFNGQSAK